MSTWPTPPNYHEHPDVGYKVLLQQPQYPVIYTQPTFTQVVTNMRPALWALTGGMTLLGAAFGYYKGATMHWQRPAMYFTGVFFGKTGFFVALGDSSYRLMGFRENKREVRSCLPHLAIPETYT